MRDDLKKRLLNSSKYIDKEFLFSLFEVFESYNINEEILEKAVNLITHENNTYNFYTIPAILLSNAAIKKSYSYKKERKYEFFEYLEQLKKVKGSEYMKQFFEKTILKIEQEFNNINSNELPNSNNKYTFFHFFVKELILDNPDDLKLIYDTESVTMTDEGSVIAVIGGVNVGHLDYEKNGQNCIKGIDFRTLPGLEGMGIGSFIFYDLCHRLKKEGGDFSFIAFCVKVDGNAARIYEKWGAYPFDIFIDEETGEECVVRLTEEIINEYNIKFCGYLFSSDVIKEIANKKSKIYTHSEQLQLIK